MELIPESPGETDDRALRGRVNRRANVGFGTDVAAHVDDNSSLTTPIRSQESVGQEGTPDDPVL